MFMVLPSSGYWCNNSLMHCSIALLISVISSPESVSQEVERERRITPDTERKLQGMTVNLQEDYYVMPCQHSFLLSHFIQSHNTHVSGVLTIPRHSAKISKHLSFQNGISIIKNRRFQFSDDDLTCPCFLLFFMILF